MSSRNPDRPPMQIDTDTRDEYDRYDALRRLNTCPLCQARKDSGCLVCWSCYHQRGLKFGMEPEVQQIIDRAAVGASGMIAAALSAKDGRPRDQVKAAVQTALAAVLQPAAPVREVRMVLVPHVPDTARWTDQDRAQVSRTLSYTLAEQMSDYGASVVLNALALALTADMAAAALAANRPILATAYEDAASDALALALDLERDEQRADR